MKQSWTGCRFQHLLVPMESLRDNSSRSRKRIFNLVIWRGELFVQLSESKTIFTSKKTSSTEPGDFRPITVTSVMVRQLHCNLYRRISQKLPLDIRQHAFITADGCAENIVLVDLLLHSHPQNFRSFYVASLDKAFGTVLHGSILSATESIGLPAGLVN